KSSTAERDGTPAVVLFAAKLGASFFSAPLAVEPNQAPMQMRASAVAAMVNAFCFRELGIAMSFLPHEAGKLTTNFLGAAGGRRPVLIGRPRPAANGNGRRDGSACRCSRSLSQALRYLLNQSSV